MPENIYEGGQGDARQTTRAHLEASEVLFRPRYRKLTETEVDLHDRIKTQAAVLAALFYEVEPIHAGPSRNRERGANVQLAIRNLEDAVYRAVKGLTGPTIDPQAEKVAAHDKAERLDRELEKAKASHAHLFGDAKGDLAKDVATGERKTGIADLPADQQEQLDKGQAIAPNPDPGSRPVDEPARVAENETPERDTSMRGTPSLLGSDAFASHVDIGGTSVQLGTLVVNAQTRAGISVHAWNDLGQAIRDALIEKEITIQRQQVGGLNLVNGDAPAAPAARPVDDDGGRGSTGEAATVTNGPQA